ncbi:MAG: CRISPR-associated protein Cas4 [Clostridium sp.]|nr:CRISPR-associated protein Cas4 [Acetatifactor muris]MCM1561979.1 CRISPR-associated protein Cas4 [Clostridium sp.]
MQSFSDDESRELFPLSWLSQYGYCKRRCSLLALEQIWQENEYTAAGRIQHKRVHTARTEQRGEVINIYEMPVFSRRLGVSGFCDCVEARLSPSGVSVPYGEGKYTFFPVEYKHGIVRDEEEYHLQLCAQAICLEERFGTQVQKGAIFFIDAHRRDEVVLTEELRAKTWETAKEISKMIEDQKLISAVYGAKCKKCSLQEVCRPRIVKSSRPYNDRLWEEMVKEIE